MIPMKLIRTAALIVILLPLSVQADVIHVPADQPTIQAGIDAAVDGDTVLVAPGYYWETIDFLGKAIAVRSEQGPYVTTIDGDEGGTVVTFQNSEPSDSILEGFEIRKGVALLGGGILCDSDTSPTIKDNLIAVNVADSRGGGIFCNNASPLIIDNLIIGNATMWGLENVGGGISCVNSAAPTIIDNIIAFNDSGTGGGIGCEASHPTMINNMITGNISRLGFGGGGVYCDTSNPEITNCSIVWNIGCGLECEETENPRINNSIIWGNAGVQIQGSPMVTYSDVQGGYPGEGNIDAFPRFASGIGGLIYLRQMATGHPVDSPCLDAGDPSSEVIEGTTRTDRRPDTGVVDMGYHYSPTACLDQYLASYRGVIISSKISHHSPIGQSFVPSGSDYWRIDLYLPIGGYLPTGGRSFDPVTVDIHEETISGPIIASAESRPDALPFGWVSFIFDPVVNLIPGDTYVIEVSTESAAFWHSTDNTYPFGMAYTFGDPRPGEDFLFRTFIDGVNSDLLCIPSSGTLPFTTYFGMRLTNGYYGYPRQIAAQLGIVTAGGLSLPNWKSGQIELGPDSEFIIGFNQLLPSHPTLIGTNTFTLVAEDVTPAPYNQPPYPPSGDIDTSTCTVTGIEP